MIAEGLFDRFPMENIYGMHNSPGMPAGTFAIRPGPMMAGGAFFDIAIDGVGAHGARPEHSVDPVIAASYITTALQTIVARNTKPVDTAVVSVTQIRTGDAYNVIPQTAHMKGTVRAFSRDTMQLIEQRMRDIPTGVGQGLGAGVTVDFRETFARSSRAERIRDRGRCRSRPGRRRQCRPQSFADHGLKKISAICSRSARAPTSVLATAPAKDPAKCTIPPTISSTIFCHWDPVFGLVWGPANSPPEGVLAQRRKLTDGTTDFESRDDCHRVHARASRHIGTSIQVDHLRIPESKVRRDVFVWHPV